MARLQIQADGSGLESRSLHLHLGSNHVGRNPDCDFQIDHSTVSSRHCEFVLSNEGVLLRDCNSTNGTFVDGKPVKEAWLQVGQIVNLGDVRLLVEVTEIAISIPTIQKPHAPQHKFPQAGVGSPVVMPPGALVCPRHERFLATYTCKKCNELMCGKCVHVLQRKGGPALLLCPVCSGPCERIQTERPKEKTFFDKLRSTVKMPFLSHSPRSPEEKK